MTKQSQLRTTGDLRQYLSDSILALRDGRMSADEASKVSKLASQINESLYSEIKISIAQAAMGTQSPSLGNLQLGGASHALLTSESK